MDTLICPSCGCSLVRLGISKDKAVPHSQGGEEYFFCCQGCVDVFIADPPKYLQRTSDVVVCPSCLAEKPVARAVKVTLAGHEVHTCGCPYCAEVFEKDPDFYIKRLKGIVPNEGVLDHEGCSVRPE